MSCVAFVFLCHSENTIGADPEISSLSQLDDRSSGEGTLWTPVLFNSRTRLMERVVFACLSFAVSLTSKLHTAIMIVWAPRHTQAIWGNIKLLCIGVVTKESVVLTPYLINLFCCILVDACHTMC